MLKTTQNIYSEQNEHEPSQNNQFDQYKIQVLEGRKSHHQKSQKSFKGKLQRNIITLDAKEEVESLNSDKVSHSDDMDIDEQNDIVNELSYIEQLQKFNEEDQMFANFSPRERILHANTKKHQGNEHFRQDNLEQAIEAYKFGLSLLKPQSFTLACPGDCLLMAELTSNILYNMGTCYFILMSYRYAIKFYDQSILIKPNYAKAIHNRALCHLQEGNLLSAYNDIKLAFNYDRHNASIHNDLKRIEEQYFGTYQHQNLQKPNGHLDHHDKKILSKSMIQCNFNEFILEQDSETPSNSMIGEEQNLSNKTQTKRPQKEKTVKQTIQEQPAGSNYSRQKIRSFYGKKFYRNQLQKPSRFISKQSSSTINSPKFRPFILNKTIGNGIMSPHFSEQKKAAEKGFQNSAGEIFEREKRINLFQGKIDESHDKINGGNEFLKKKRNQSKQKKQKDGQDNFWGYIPIVVATGFGLYHSLRAVLGK